MCKGAVEIFLLLRKTLMCKSAKINLIHSKNVLFEITIRKNCL